MFKRKLKKYKYRIIFKNKNEANGIIEAHNMTEVYDILLKNKFTQVAHRTKGFYWNAEEINTAEIELIETE